jgi:hypothetical protein
MSSDAIDSCSNGNVEVLLDGSPVCVPSERRSAAAIRCYLDTLALQQQRVLCSFHIDGLPVDPARPLAAPGSFSRVEAQTLELDHLPLHLINAARQQLAGARQTAESTIVLVLINDGAVARECWWELARKLEEPLLTLSLLPTDACGSANEFAPVGQLRRWQLEQLAAILKDVDQACWSEDTRVLSNVLEQRVMPWLDSLSDSLSLLHDTICAGVADAESRAWCR